MKTDRILDEKILFSAADVLARGVVKGVDKHSAVDGGRRVLALRSGGTLAIYPPTPDLSAFNELVFDARATAPTEGGLGFAFHCSTRSPGMACDDCYRSFEHVGQPAPWRGWREVIVPAVNLVPIGFPRGWHDIKAIDVCYHGPGALLMGDVRLRNVERPAGPRMSDAELFAALDLRRPDLAAVRRCVRAGDLEGAVKAFAARLRRETFIPPLEQPPVTTSFSKGVPDDICRRFILGQQLPRELDWHANPVGYLEWMHAFNRHSWFTPVVLAYHRTRNRKYARAIEAFVRSWIEQNPEPIGHCGGLDPAWETLSTACRLDWTWPQIFNLARTSREIADRTLADMAKTIYAHAEHLLKYHAIFNWYVAESTGIMTAATLLPMFRRAALWRKTAQQRLERALRTQVLRDGVQYEMTPGYHMMCADLFHRACIRAAFRGHHFSKAFRRRLLAMFNYQALIMRPDGTFPVMNDSGYALPKGVPRLLAMGRLEQRPDWVWAGSGGTEGKPPEAGSVHFPDAGYVVMRSGWDRAARWAFMDAGAVGVSHCHEDKLQVEFHAFGTTFLADPGISSYQDDPVVRHLRSTHAHNTLVVDGLGQARCRFNNDSEFGASSRGKNLFAAGRGLDIAESRYDDPYAGVGKVRKGGTLRKTRSMWDDPGVNLKVLEGMAHTRTLVFVRPDYWIVLDRLEGQGRHAVEALWHFTPMDVRADAQHVLRTHRVDKPNIELICRGDWEQGSIRIVTGRLVPPQGYIALDEQVKPTPCGSVLWRGRLPLIGVTVVVPSAGGGSGSGFQVSTRTVDRRGLIVTIRRPGAITDTLLWRTAGRGAIQTPNLAWDARLALVRTDDRSDRLLYVGLFDGRRLCRGAFRMQGAPGKLVEIES